MGIRTYFKGKMPDSEKFKLFCKNRGANYYEDCGNGGIWIMPEKVVWFNNRRHSAIRLNEDMEIYFGYIEPSCENFVGEKEMKLNQKEWKWFFEVLSKLVK